MFFADVLWLISLFKLLRCRPVTFRSVKRERSGFKRFSIVENCRSKNIYKCAAMAQQVEHVLGKEYRGEKRASRKPLKIGKKLNMLLWLSR